MTTPPVCTRFAPSPTGNLHIGSVRTALFSWLYARQQKGKFILRIEDTDTQRSSADAVQGIIDGLQWLGLDHDAGPYFQTQRQQRYQAVIQTLLEAGNAYYCRCDTQRLDDMRKHAIASKQNPRYDRRCRDQNYAPSDTVPATIRFKNPLHGEVVIDDHIQGQVTYQNAELDDLIIARTNAMPTYNLAVIVDDMDMQITHVIRGDDHLNNTPRQINILHALDTKIPQYVHIPLIMGEDGKRLSKRHNASNILQYKQQGYLPKAILNYLIRLGWSHGDQEIFSIAEMLEYFTLEGINKSAASINPKKLLWLNQHHIKTTTDIELVDQLKDFFIDMGIDTSTGPDLLTLVKIQKQRVKTIQEMAQQSQYFYLDFSTYDTAMSQQYLSVEIAPILQTIRQRLAVLDSWTDEELHQTIIDVANEFTIKLGKIAQPLRFAITATTASPSIDITLRLLGKQRVLQRLDLALQNIANHDA